MSSLMHPNVDTVDGRNPAPQLVTLGNYENETL